MKLIPIFLGSLLSLEIHASELVHSLDIELSDCHGYNIHELTIQKAHRLFQTKKLTSSSLTRCYLVRISKMNPYLGAVLEVNPDAIEIAEDLDRHFSKDGSFKGNLHGIPILIKDNIGTFDKMNTTAGAWAMLEVRPKEDAEVVKKLRESGAIIIGKANMAEWAGFRSFKGNKDWSGRGGRAKNPYVLSETTNGSSSGSAAAVAASLALAALGTETDGSIVGPAHLCSVVGLKPSFGLTSNSGVIPLAPSQDSVGAITKTIQDNVEVTYAIAEPSLRRILKPSIKIPVSRNKFIKAGLLVTPYLNDKSLPSHQKTAIESIIKKLPYQKISVKNLDADFSAISREKELKVLGSEFKFHLEQYLTTQVIQSNNNPKSLQEIIDYNHKYHIEDLKIIDLSLLEYAQNSSSILSSEHKTNLNENQNAARNTIDLLLKYHDVEVLIAPSNLDLASETNTPPAIAGYPIITVPAGLGPFGVPFGISIYGPRNSEATLLQVGQLFEYQLPHYRPKFIPNLKNVEKTKVYYRIPLKSYNWKNNKKLN